jgi:beta-phosphoglucomutase
MEKPTGVLFDCNGVIIDDYLMQKAAWNTVSLEKRGKPISDEEMIKYSLSIPTMETANWITGGTLSQDEVYKVGEHKRDIISQLTKNGEYYRLMPGITEFFDALKQSNIPMTIVTSARESSMQEYYEKFDLGRWFVWEKIVSNDGTHNPKPAPDPYLIGARRLGHEPQKCLVFEDSPGGATAAYAAGVRSIVGISSNLPEDLLAKLPGVIRVVQDFYQVSVPELFEV